MMSRQCWEIRLEAWRLMWRDGWFWRFLGVSLLLGLAGVVADKVLGFAYEHLNISHWGEYLAQYIQARMGEGMLMVPSREFALRMTAATGAAMLFGWIFEGCRHLGESIVLLRAARGEKDNWLAGVWIGLRTPLACLALMLLTVLGMLATVVPVVAAAAFLMRGSLSDPVSLAMLALLGQIPALIAHGYLQPMWLVRAERPDCGLLECLAETRRRLKGHRCELVRLLQSYWQVPVLTFVPMVLLAFPATRAAAIAFAVLAAIPLYVIVPWHMRLGVALFWREIQ